MHGINPSTESILWGSIHHQNNNNVALGEELQTCHINGSMAMVMMVWPW